MIRFGMAIMEMVEQLTKGFVKATGRQPDNLEKLKIQQEGDQRFKDMNKFVDMEGNVIDTSKGIMGGRQIQENKELSQAIKEELMKKDNPYSDLVNTPRPKTIKEREAEVLADMEKNNKEAVQRIKNRKMVEDAIDNASPGFAGDRKYDAQLVADDLAEKRFGKDFYDLDQKQQMDLYGEALDGLDDSRFKNKPEPEDMAQGGRAGFDKGGMSRRSFLKILGGLAAIPIVGKFLKPLKTAKGIKSVPIIKTDNVAGKPEWFDALVNKVIIEGDDVTKKFATADRQAVHQKTLDDGSVVRVTEDVDDGAVRVEYESVDNMYEDPVQLQYKKPLPDEGDPNPAADFTTAESGPVGRQTGPDDYDIEIDEAGGTSISDLTSDVSKLKEYATGKKPTLKEFVQSKKRKDKAKAISEGGEAEAEEVVRRQGDFEQFGDLPDEADFASGGIARMLGE